MYLPSHLGLLQNKHVTELYQSQPSDPAKAHESYSFADSEAPFFTNLAMLGNAAALGYLTAGKTREAVRLYDELVTKNADQFDRWSVLCNRLISHHLYYGEVDQDEIESFASEIQSAEVSPVWQYHILRFALNLIQIDRHGAVAEQMWALVRSSSYFGDLAGENAEAYLKVIVERDFSSHTENGRLTGQVGAFFQDQGVFPSTDFDWT